jgi:hypothetical protein
VNGARFERQSEEENYMRVSGSVLAIVAVCCLGVVVPRTASADEWNKETVMTFSRDVQIPGRVLPAGKYVFKLADSQANRHVVQVFDGDGRILATVLTIPTDRHTATDDTHIVFGEQSEGAAFPIKIWFYSGELEGQEFIYPPNAN